MYRLREERLKEFYATGDMDSTNFGITKVPTKTSHGDSLADQSFQSFKTKEIRDSESPTHDIKFTRGGAIVPNTSGWNVVTSSEVSPDGRAYKTESLATTEGVQKITGGHSQFAGINENMQKASHQGDDKNYVKTAAESSKTQLQEKTVVGDENNGRIEQKSSSVVSSSSHMSTSKHTSSGPEAILDHQKVLNEFDQLVDSATATNRSVQQQRQLQQQKQHETSAETRSSSSTVRKEHQVREQHHEEQHHQQQQQQQHYQQMQNERYITEDTTNQDRLQTNQMRTTDTNQSEKQFRRKLIQEEVDLLAAAPGQIISRSVEYPDPNTKVITETKTLADGTTVTTRKYETKSASSKSWSTSSNQRESTSSRSVVEDRARQNRVEYVTDNKKRVASDDYNIKRITGEPSPQILRDIDHQTTKTSRQQQEQQRAISRETTQQQQVHDRTEQSVQKTREEKIHEQQTKTVHEQQRHKQESDVQLKGVTKIHDINQQNLDRSDRAEKLRDQVEMVTVDSSHRTVKKDLGQTVRDAKMTNQDFIETEKGCAMVDFSQRSPEKYTMHPKTDSTSTAVHGQTTRQQDRQEHTEITHELVQESQFDRRPQKPCPDFTTQGFPSVKPKKTDEPRKPSQDFTTQGFPSVRPQKPEEPKKTPQDFSTHGFPSVRSQKPDQDFTTQGFPSTRTPSPQKVPTSVYDHPVKPRGDQRTPDRFDGTTTKTSQTYTSENVAQQSTEAQQTIKSTDKHTSKQTEEFISRGFPSQGPEKITPTRPYDSPRQEDKPRGVSHRPDSAPSTSPERITPTRPYDSPRQEDKPRGVPQRPDSVRPTENVEDLRSVTETRQTTEHRQLHREKEDFSTHGFPSGRPDRSSPSKPHEKPADIERRPVGSPRQPEPVYSTGETQEIRTTSETMKTTQQRDVQKRQEDFTTHGFPSAKPQDVEYKPKQPDQTYGKLQEEPYYKGQKPQYPGEPYTSYPKSQEKVPFEPREPQRPLRPSDQTQKVDDISHKTQTTTVHQRAEDFTTQGFPSTKPQQPEKTYSPTTRPDQTPDFSTQGFPSARPQQGIPSTTPQQPEKTYSPTTRPDFSTQGFPSSRPQQPEKIYSPTTRPDQTYPGEKLRQPEKDFDETSSVTTEKTDVSETTRRMRDDYFSTRISVEVDAAHDAFARSLRCVSPVDQQRGSVKSLRTSTSSVRSSTSPDKQSRRSPSRDSDTSRFSSSTVTKNKDRKDIARRVVTTAATKKSPTQEKPSTRDDRHYKDQTDLYKTKETVDLTKTRREKEELQTGARQVIKDTKGELYTHDIFAEKDEDLYQKVPREYEPESTQKLYSQTEKSVDRLHSVEEPLFEKRYIAPLCPDTDISSRKPISPVLTTQSQCYPSKPSDKSPLRPKTPLQAAPLSKPPLIHKPVDSKKIQKPKTSELTQRKITETRYITKPTSKVQDTTQKTRTRETIAVEFIDKPTKPVVPNNIRKPTTKPQTHTTPTRPSLQTTTTTTSKDVTDTRKIQSKYDIQTTRSDTSKPYTIHGPIPKEYPEGYVPRKDVYPSVPKASRTPYSSTEGSTRPSQRIPDRGTQPTRPSGLVGDSPKSPKKPESKTPLRQTGPIYDAPKSPKKRDEPSPRTPQTERKTSSDTKTSRFTKTMKIENAILRDTDRKSPKKPDEKTQSSEDEGFEPESPRSASPSVHKTKKDYTQRISDLDATDITVEVNLKNVGRDVDLVTTLTDTDSTKKRYLNEKFIEREKEDVEINKKTRTTKEDTSRTEETHIYDVDRNLGEETHYPSRRRPEEERYPEDGHPRIGSPSRQVPSRETHYPDETGEPFYLAPTPKGDDIPKKPGDARKPKPPLHRSETYEERCRKILGMEEETTTSELKKTNITEAQDFITSERTVQEKDRTTMTQSPVPSPRSTSPRKPSQLNGDDSLLVTTTETISTREEIKGRPSTYSPTRKPKTPGREPSPTKETDDNTYYTTPRDSYSPTSSPYSSLSRKSTPKGTPKDSPHSRSPASSPTRKYQPSTRPEQSPQEPIDKRSVGSSRPSSSPTRRVDIEKEDIRRRTDKSSIIKQETYDVEETSGALRSHESTFKTIDSTSIRRSPSPSRSPASSPERKPFSRSPDQSPVRQTPSHIEHRTRETKQTTDKRTGATIDIDRKTTTTRRTDKISQSPETSPTRRQPYTTEVCYEISDRKTVKEKISTESPKSRSPTTSPTRRTPITKSAPSPTSSPGRKTHPSSRPIESEYETTSIKKSTGRTTESLDIDRKISRKTIKDIKSGDVPRSPERSPNRRGPQTVETITISRKSTDKPRPSDSTPSKLRTPTSQPSPSRRSPFTVEYETKVHKETTDRKVDISRKTSTTSVKTTKTVETTSSTRQHPSHVTTAKIQLSPTPVRKIKGPEKKGPREPETKTTKSTRSTITIEPRTPVQRTPLKQPDKVQQIYPGRRIDTKKYSEMSIEEQKRTERKVKRFEEEVDSSIVREDEEVTIVKERKSGPITPTHKKSPTKKPVTERKESAPVYGTRPSKDTSQKMTRSTSDNLIKTTITKRTKPEIETTLVGPGTRTPRKTSTDKTPGKSERRPNKHLATKTINLSTTSHIINSEDMENVIIDIQQAKSSREPSPNKIIPTPVSLDEDTGKARYPDTVQEPDEEPRRKPKVNNIPIFEEETNNFVGCHITEVDESYEEKVQKRATTTRRESDDETIVKTIKTTKTSRETSPSKDSKRLTDITDDECLLSVHDKVTKFINTAEEVKKPKTSAPFRRETPREEEFPEKDDCLLSVNAKVSKFLSTAESVTKPVKPSSSKPVERVNINEIDEELRTDECVLSVSEKVNKFVNTAEKLTAPTPQRAPELVAKIEREISRQSDEGEKDVVSKTTIKSSVTERYMPGKPTKPAKPDEKPSSPKPVLKSSEAIRKAKQVFENGATTTTSTRQKDIISRPSVWEGRKTTTDVRLQDIGVYKKYGKDVEEEFVERKDRQYSVSPSRDVEDTPTKPLKESSILTDSVSSKKDLFESRISTSRTEASSTQTTKSKTGNQTVKTTTKSSDTRPSSRTQPGSDYNQKIRQTTTRSVYSPSRETAEVSRTKVTSERPYYDDHSPTRSSRVHVEKHTTQTTTTSKYPSETTPSKYPGLSTPKRSHDVDSPKSPSSRPKIQPGRLHTHSENMSDSVHSKRSLFEKSEHDSRTATPTGPRPSYMDHTLSSLEHIRRDSVEVNRSHLRRSSVDSSSIHELDSSIRSGSKFGVELKHVDSKVEKTRRRSSSDIPHIEDIFDLELLEEMLHTVVGYEHRRRIRAQIRLVKKMIETQNREAAHTEYTRIVKHERSSSRGSTPSPDRHLSPSRKESFKSSSSRFIETESEHISRHVEKVVKERSRSPQSKIERFEKVKEVRKTGTEKSPGKKSGLSKEIKEEKPIWATRNVLKKTSENDKSFSSSSSSTVKKMSTTSKTQSQRQKIVSDEDCITSSYGIGPTDEDGKPLFGIRALKKKSQPGETTKVTGTVVTEKYYSENGAQPVGERKVTVYSTNPDDIEKFESKFGDRQSSETIRRERSSKDGMTTVTKVEKISKLGDPDVSYHQFLE